VLKKIVMKKFIIISLTSTTLVGSAQFFKGVGVFGSLTHSAHTYVNKNENLKDPFIDNYASVAFGGDKNLAYYPSTHYSREYFSWGAGAFAEFINHKQFRWQTELEYTHKGAREKEIIDLLFGFRNDSWGVNKYTYIQWNNYLKYFIPFGFTNAIYLMPGIRLEYLYKQSTAVFNPYSSSFKKFWFSGNVGLGYEFPFYKKINMFVEYHWNPDILATEKNNVFIRNRTFELRVGLIYRPRKKSIDDCNAPRYNGPDY
jgi:hypothetical protein